MSNLGSIQDFVSRAASQTGFERERYIEANLPTVTSKLQVILFLGDLRAQPTFSSLLLHNYLKKVSKDKYTILCSWPGQANLYPYVDEYWSVSDLHSLRDLAQTTTGFANENQKYDVYARSLRRYFESVKTAEDFNRFYDSGFTKEYFSDIGEMVAYYPAIPAFNTQIQKRISQEAMPVFIYPAKIGHTWYRKQIIFKFTNKFWVDLCSGLLSQGITPVVCQNYATYEVDQNFGEKCIYLTDRNWSNTLSAMRSCKCVLDTFTGISRFAYLARVPSLICDDRQRYFFTKDYEIRDLVGRSLPSRYVFSFPTMVESGHYQEVLEQIMNVTKDYLPKIKDYDMISPTEYYVPVSYDLVREHKRKRLGMKFIKVERLVING